MIEAPTPRDEAARVATLHDLNILYTPAEERFDRITRMACRLLDVPTALVSLVDSECQWFKSAQGLDAPETPRSISFCGHAITSSETLVVPDTLRDERFADNPLVIGEPHIRFYAGHPLHADNGARLGTLCVIDHRPRKLTDSDLQALRDLAGWVSNELRLNLMNWAQRELIAERDELQRRAMIDSLTRLLNREAVLEVLEREMERATRTSSRLCVVVADVDRFKQVNDTYGHPTGDAVLKSVASNLRSAFRTYDAVGRLGGEEFLVVLSECGPAEGLRVAERVRLRVEGQVHDTPEGPLRVTLSQGMVTWDGTQEASPSQLIEAADRAMYRAKKGGRSRVEHDAFELPERGQDPRPQAARVRA